MSIVEILSLSLVLLFLAVALIRLFKTPLKLALRTTANTVLGFGALWAVNLTTAYTGLSLGLSAIAMSFMCRMSMRPASRFIQSMTSPPACCTQ